MRGIKADNQLTGIKVDEKHIRREFEQIFEQKSKHAGCLRCNGHGEIAVQDGGKFKSVPCGCDERHDDIKYRRY